MMQSMACLVFLQFLLFINLSRAQSCWRNTTCTGPADTAFPGPWESNIFAPSSRTVSPKSVVSTCPGQTTSSYPGPVRLSGNGSQIVFDFGIEVGGIATVKYSSNGTGSLGLAFTEAKNFIGEWSDSSNGAFMGPDGAIYGNITTAGEGTYVMPDKRLRGGFRYMTAFLITNGTTSVDITDVSLELGFQPTWSNLQAYQGYFHSNDELLNRICYSGAYTLQTNSVPSETGRQVPFLTTGWANNGTLGPGDTIIVDGAKRDRAVWPGDMGVAVPSTFVSTGELTSIKNALQTMYNTQNSDGAFAESGPPLNQQGSDTYHMWSMIGTYNYVLFTNDTTFLMQNWPGYQKAMSYIESLITYPSGLLNVTGIRDWARFQQGYNNSEAQMILYHTLLTGAELAVWAGDTTGLNASWASKAENLQTAINSHCYDVQYGAFKDNASVTSLHPQDANSLAVLFGVVDDARAESISERLTDNWSPIGAVAPELPPNVSPFISSFEIQAHLAIGQTDRALDLIRRSWGWYINNPNGSESTVIEGYLQNGSFSYRSNRGYDYDESYPSHSHGWSSGPTSALTNYVLGLSITSPVGMTWKLAPQFGDLTSVQGGFTTTLGSFQASWNRTTGGEYVLEYSVPENTKGTVTLPVSNSTHAPPCIEMDGKSLSHVQVSGGGSIAMPATGGKHSIKVG